MLVKKKSSCGLSVYIKPHIQHVSIELCYVQINTNKHS